VLGALGLALCHSASLAIVVVPTVRSLCAASGAAVVAREGQGATLLISVCDKPPAYS
jgi:glycerol dehydrogenase-like iron-containing ADH family enzyme